MVKHGKNKKRRAGRYGRTQLKNKNFKRWDPKPKINDPTVQKLWDVTKSPKVNLANMGLAADVNKATNAQSGVNVVELFDVPDSDNMGPSRREKWPLNAEEQEYIAKCLRKHTDSSGTPKYSKMFRDLKVNPLQHTEEKLEKMGARFILLNPDQVLIDEISNKVLGSMEHGKEIEELLEERRQEKME